MKDSTRVVLSILGDNLFSIETVKLNKFDSTGVNHWEVCGFSNTLLEIQLQVTSIRKNPVTVELFSFHGKKVEILISDSEIAENNLQSNLYALVDNAESDVFWGRVIKAAVLEVYDFYKKTGKFPELGKRTSKWEPPFPQSTWWNGLNWFELDIKSLHCPIFTLLSLLEATGGSLFCKQILAHEILKAVSENKSDEKQFDAIGLVMENTKNQRNLIGHYNFYQFGNVYPLSRVVALSYSILVLPALFILGKSLWFGQLSYVDKLKYLVPESVRVEEAQKGNVLDFSLPLGEYVYKEYLRNTDNENTWYLINRTSFYEVVYLITEIQKRLMQTIEVTVVGLQKAGKSSLLHHWLKVDCKPSSKVATLKTRHVKTKYYSRQNLRSGGDDLASLSIWDTPGRNDYTTAAAEQAKHAMGVGMIFVVVISCEGNKVKPTGTDLKIIRELIAVYGGDNIVVCLSKVDLNVDIGTKQDLDELVERFWKDFEEKIPKKNIFVLFP
eukprot:TRINITY_DN3001_c0_g3_i2.p1 TRINITY_DN3001_c0_g3~~TRINITY_DN3001_c0_g3_i2.p1  ORF type:complete len:497 (-),score=80.22 TRINITY_DN3001_c0_g3_i2:949-2439(-)